MITAIGDAPPFVTAAAERWSTTSEPALVHVDAANYPLVASPYVTGAGTDWAQADKTANSTVDGHTHANALHRLTDLRLALLRFPDGEFSNCFDWRSSVGPQAGRPKMLINWDPAGSNNHPCYPLQRDVFGTGEFLAETAQLTALAGRKVQPLITVNICTVTAGRNCGSGGYPDLCPDPLHVAGGGCPGAAQAAGWVEYLNGPTNSHYGALRAANGHPDAYGVSYFEIGNETPISETPERPYYSQVLNAYAGAMRAVDPGIKIIAQGDCGCSGLYEPARIHTLLAYSGSQIDLIAPHLYIADGDLKGGVSSYLDALDADVAAAGYSGRIGVLPTEWSAHDDSVADPAARFGDLQAAIADASVIQSFIRHGVLGSAFYSISAGVMQLMHCSAIDPADAADPCSSPASTPYLSVPGQVVGLLGASLDPWRLHASSTGNLSVTATTNGRVVHVQLVNNSDRDLTAVVSFEGLIPGGHAGLRYLTGARTDLNLSHGAGDISALSTVVPRSGLAPAGAASMSITVPSRSVSVLTSELAVAP